MSQIVSQNVYLLMYLKNSISIFGIHVDLFFAYIILYISTALAAYNSLCSVVNNCTMTSL